MPDTTLTLFQGNIKAAFREITVEDEWTIAEEQQRAEVALRNQYAEVDAIEDRASRAYKDHPDQPRYTLRWWREVNQYPYIIGAWAGETGPPPSLTDLQRSGVDEIDACLKDIRRRNPTLTHLPAPEATAAPNA